MDALQRVGCVGRGLLPVFEQSSHVYTAGRLHTLRWQGAATGECYARLEIVLDDLILLDRCNN